MMQATGPFDLIWCAGAIYFIGVTEALAGWRDALAPGGVVAFSQACLFRPDPPQAVDDLFEGYPVTDAAGIAACRSRRRAMTCWRAPGPGRRVGGLLSAGRGPYRRPEPRCGRRPDPGARRRRARDRHLARAQARFRLSPLRGPATMSDDLAACAAIVQRGDPARFRAVMAAPPAARSRLFPLYAFNVEVARAPYVTAEPGIAAIRLQWWIDALDEIAAGRIVRRHEVVVPLALVLSPDQARALQSVVEARFHDAEEAGFADAAALKAYLSATSGRLLEVAAAMLGQGDPTPARAAGLAQGLANWFLAVPALKAAGKRPLPDEAPAALSALAEDGLVSLAEARQAAIAPSARPAFLAVAGAHPVLHTARTRPGRILDGSLAPGPLRASLSLMRAALLGRW
ncbi:MAG: squalene/phytoene synthase family protein [Paracoccaceae bacterium]